MITAYLNVEAYAQFHRWLGRGPALTPMWDAWAAGDRKGALAAIADEVVDDLVVHGSTDSAGPTSSATSTMGSLSQLSRSLPSGSTSTKWWPASPRPEEQAP